MSAVMLTGVVGFLVSASSLVLIFVMILSMLKITMPVNVAVTARCFALVTSSLTNLLLLASFVPVRGVLFVAGFLSFVLGIGILRLRSVARVGSVILSAALVVEGSMAGYPLVMSGDHEKAIPQAGIVVVHLFYIVILSLRRTRGEFS